MILNFQKEINVIMYIIEIFKKVIGIISFEQNINKIWIFKVYVFVMFKMKYLINKMECNILSQHMGWLDGNGVCPNSKVKGSNFMGGVVYGQQWYVNWIFSYWILIIGA